MLRPQLMAKIRVCVDVIQVRVRSMTNCLATSKTKQTLLRRVKQEHCFTLQKSGQNLAMCGRLHDLCRENPLICVNLPTAPRRAFCKNDSRLDDNFHGTCCDNANLNIIVIVGPQHKTAEKYLLYIKKLYILTNFATHLSYS